MSEIFEGAVKVERFEGFGMITLRGDFSEQAVKSVVETELSLIPGVREVTVGEKGMLVWMSPDELLAIVPTQDAVAKTAMLEKELANEHVLVVNVSDARAVFRITGKGAREVLAKGAPVDLSKDAFGPGQIRRTRLGQVACAFWMSGEDQFDLICFGSVSEFVFDWLSTAGKDGSLPNYL